MGRAFPARLRLVLFTFVVVGALSVPLATGASAATGVPFELCNQQVAVVADPAGFTVELTVPAGRVYEVLAFRTSFVSSGTAGTRVVNMRIGDGAFVFPWWQVASTQPASQTVAYSGQQGAGQQSAVGGTVNAPLPGLLMLAGMKFQISVTGTQAGDDLQAMVIAYCDVAAGAVPPVQVTGEPLDVNVTNTVPVSGDLGATAATTCGNPPGTVAPSTTTTTQPACEVNVAGFTSDGLSVPVAAGLVVFTSFAGLALLWRYRR